MTDDAKRYAEIYLETCAMQYAASVTAALETHGHERWTACKSTLHDAGVRFAAALGNLDAGERAELEALRRFREGVVGLRGEIASGKATTGENMDRELALETIDALLALHAAPDAKEAESA